jgi:hypothetical protein
MEYAKEVDIAANDNEYAIGNDGDNEPLAEGKDNEDDDEYASATCCAASIILSVTPGYSQRLLSASCSQHGPLRL